MKLSIIIPVYNEVKTIEALISVVKKVDAGVKKEIIIIDDGSTDGTKEILHGLDEVKVFFLPENKGKGFAIREGIKHVTGDMVIIQDADLEYDPHDYRKLIAPIISGEAQVVYGSRRLNKNNKQHAGFAFYMGGLTLTWITNLLYGIRITDEPTCYKVFDTSLLKDIPLTCERFEFCPEITAKIATRKIPIVEVPISYRPRGRKEGKKINWTDWFHAVVTLLRFRFL